VQAELTRGHDGGIELGADRVHALLLGVDHTGASHMAVVAGVVRAVMRLLQTHLSGLQRSTERVDVVQPRGGLNGLGVALDELQGVGLPVQLFHQLQNGGDVGGVMRFDLDAIDGLAERYGIDGQRTNLILTDRLQRDDEQDGGDDGEQRDYDDRAVLHEQFDDVHGFFLEVRSRTSLRVGRTQIYYSI
jgi:hypothetical protein